MLFLYNTLTRKKESFKPLKDPDVRLYACGPTVYNYAHIGNLRTFTANDIIIRTLRFLGYRVHAEANITDIDDKTIRDSIKNKQTLKDFTELYTKLFFQDLSRLNITSFDHFTPISHLIDEMISMIQVLLDRDFAYLAEDGSIYYRVSAFKKYGNLAHLDMKGLKASARVNNDEYSKDEVADFALWKVWNEKEDGENKWCAKFLIEGKETIVEGRPGWHIECSACNRKVHGDQIDIHLGGIDLVFPHHQNEIAQSEAVTRKEFCKYWCHTGHLLVENKKMSKSAGNFYTLKDILARFSEKDYPLVARAFRMMNLQNHYRESFNFTFDRLQAAQNTIGTLDDFFRRLKNYHPSGLDKIRGFFSKDINLFFQRFVEALEDDFDTVGSVVPVFELISFIHREIENNHLTQKEKGAIIELMRHIDSVWGVMDFSLFEDTEVPKDVLDLVEQRNEAKRNKDYALSDSLRDAILAKGYRIVDGKEGVVVEKV